MSLIKSLGGFPSLQKLSFIDNAYENDEWWLLKTSYGEGEDCDCTWKQHSSCAVKRDRSDCLSSLCLHCNVRANEVKQRLNYSDNLLPFGLKHLIPKQLGRIFNYECIIGSWATVKALFFFLFNKGSLCGGFTQRTGLCVIMFFFCYFVPFYEFARLLTSI